MLHGKAYAWELNKNLAGLGIFAFDRDIMFGRADKHCRDRVAPISGLTTGAGMWLAGAIGIAVGAGYYAIAAMTTGLALVIFILLNTIVSLMKDRNK